MQAISKRKEKTKADLFIGIAQHGQILPRDVERGHFIQISVAYQCTKLGYSADSVTFLLRRL